MKVLVCGSRSWENYEVITRRLSMLERGSEIISGGARGADRKAATIGRRLGFDVTEYPADWLHEGKGAGLKRNLQMLDSKPDLVIAFWDGASTGTAHTIRNALERKIPVEAWSEDGTLVRIQQLWDLV